jgi:hypothetical protein
VKGSSTRGASEQKAITYLHCVKYEQ